MPGMPTEIDRAFLGTDIGHWLGPGDILDAEITGLGRLAVEIVKDR
jgi:2-keto-4-pentenoate hydratase/2-oxohepta-3-ene-1,7-dioic acid hydratase in catechol pathway